MTADFDGTMELEQMLAQGERRPAHMKILSMQIVLSNGDQMVSCERGADYQWRFSGPLYPRHLKFISAINELARRADE